MPSFKHSFIKTHPGSEILGVPASEIRDIIDPDFNNLIILFKFFFSLNLWLGIKLDLISNLVRRIFETLVSSHKIKSEFLKVIEKIRCEVQKFYCSLRYIQ